MSCPRCGEPVPNMSNNHKCKPIDWKGISDAIAKVKGGTVSDTSERVGADKRYSQDSNGCWNWTGRIHGSNYGTLERNGRRIFAHRFMYELLVGKVPNGLELDHLCRNRKCVNPKHLEAVSHKVNLLRGMGLAAINARKTHCSKGHLLTGKNVRVEKIHKGKSVCRRCKECDRIRHKEKYAKTHN